MQNEHLPSTAEAPHTESHRELLARLIRELMQSERAAALLLPREADRLNAASLAEPLRGVAGHARKTLDELGELVRKHEIPISRVGVLLGSSVSVVVQTLFDQLVDAERAYRRARLEMHHGIDLVQLIRRVADASGMVEIGGFCTRWLDERTPLGERASQAMSWFAEHPDQAAESPLPRLVRARLGERMRPRASGESQPQA